MASSQSSKGHGGGKGGDERVPNPIKVYVGGVHGHMKGHLMKTHLEDFLGVAGVTQCFVTRE